MDVDLVAELRVPRAGGIEGPGSRCTSLSVALSLLGENAALHWLLAVLSLQACVSLSRDFRIEHTFILELAHTTDETAHRQGGRASEGAARGGAHALGSTTLRQQHALIARSRPSLRRLGRGGWYPGFPQLRRAEERPICAASVGCTHGQTTNSLTLLASPASTETPAGSSGGRRA